MRPIPSSKNRRQAFTLIEMITAAGVSVLAFFAVVSTLLYGFKSTAIVGNYSDMNRLDREAIDIMTRDIRQADQVTGCTSNQLKILAVDMNTGATNTLTYDYSSSAKTLSRTLGSSTRTLVTGIVPNTLQFTMYQRNPIGGSISNYTTTNYASCKVVQLTWRTSRSTIGLGETDTGQSCAVVIRKE
jgi:Tfp pilus assembly protein PilW